MSLQEIIAALQAYAQAQPQFTQADIDAAVAATKSVDQAAVDALTNQVSALQADDDAKTKIIQGIQALLNPPVQP